MSDDARDAGDARLVNSREIFAGRRIRLSVDQVELPGGKQAELEMIRHPGAAAVVPIDEDGNVLLVRQYRWATSGFLLEVPAGTLDPGERPEHCAAREVEEETGYRPGALTELGWIWTTPGFTNEKIWLYRAENLTPTEQSLQVDEVLSVERVPLREAVAMAASGEIADAKSVCALLRLGTGRAARRSPLPLPRRPARGDS